MTEAICRLLPSGETALDIGVNIGQMTSLLRVMAGSKGRVLSFDPSGAVLRNVRFGGTTFGRRLCSGGKAPTGLGRRRGEAHLEVPQHWAQNRGVAKLSSSTENGSSIPVKVTTLDRVLPPGTHVGVCKIDVEGHELSVFKGAAQLLADRRIRDIIYEDFSTLSQPRSQPFESGWFHLFHLDARFLGPSLTGVDVRGG